ncbi:uncharacterized protein DS421_17g584220 [Arachis hypogaea]|nr:uncharacterized protein DS421_17g584220 [Arachis hypogaea]
MREREEAQRRRASLPPRRRVTSGRASERANRHEREGIAPPRSFRRSAGEAAARPRIRVQLAAVQTPVAVTLVQAPSRGSLASAAVFAGLMCGRGCSSPWSRVVVLQPTPKQRRAREVDAARSTVPPPLPVLSLSSPTFSSAAIRNGSGRR